MPRPMSEATANDARSKEQVRKRDKYQCRCCGITEQKHYEQRGRRLEVHRIIPGISYQCTNWCETLCYTCHQNKPRSGSQVIFFDECNPYEKSVVGLAASLIGPRRKAIKKDFEAFLKTLEKKYGTDYSEFFWFGDFDRWKSIARKQLKELHKRVVA